MTTTTPRYEVTASKYRPKTFDELAGQEFVVSTIKNSLKSGHVANAYLFSGPRGCGKTSAARILARSLNCEKGPEAGPCSGMAGADVCSNCLSISRGASMDVLEIDGASNNSVNDVRQIKDEVLFPPQSGRYKVYIIDEVHMLSQSAFNALLKTIEEPPPYICFIFATTELHKVPPTIKSRCQQFNFRLIPVETIQEILKKICAENNIHAEDDALFWIARESTGSMRDAFTLFDQIVSFSEGKIRSELIREKLGIIGLDKLNAFSEACAANDTTSVFALTDEILGSGVAIEQFVIDLAGYYRSLLLLKNGVTRESILGYRPAQFSVKALDAYDSIRLEQALDILLDCYRNMRYGVSVRFELEIAVSKLAWLNKWVSPAELKNAIDNAQAILNQGFSVSQNQQSPRRNDSQQSQNNEKPAYQQPASDGRSLQNEFQRMIAAKDAATAASTTADSSTETDDDDVPLWNNAVNKNTDAETYPQVEQVRSIIPGTIVP
ncbi:MAG: DNA polymerase III subunit gamma/tau [Treponema sp.]|jgi:DNA polymerase-3 subunit gamma/tau|nr:DNA polymerase III subunit gamma/tau [Treponema sp.]